MEKTLPVCTRCGVSLRCENSRHFIVTTSGGEPVSFVFAPEFGCDGCDMRVAVADREPVHSGDAGFAAWLVQVLDGPHTLMEWG